jgi:hypothetical protein
MGILQAVALVVVVADIPNYPLRAVVKVGAPSPACCAGPVS